VVIIAAVDHQPRAELEKLLIFLLTEADVRRIVRLLPGGEVMHAELPGTGVSFIALVHQAVSVLERHGRLDGTFFDALVAERPARRDEIRTLAERMLESTAVTRLITAVRPSPPLERSAWQPGMRDQECAQRTLLVSYYQGLLKRCDIVDLAGLPEGDIYLATKQFFLRNLFVPLHAHVEVTASEASKPSDIEALRLERRRHDAGRHQRSGRRSMESHESAGPQSVGARLGSSRRLLVLGDPGSGKSTLLRWIATAYLLQQSKDPNLDRLPAIDTLPRQDLWPILIRCRDLSPDTLQSVTLEGILRQALAKLELPSSNAQEREELNAILRELLAQGRAILLIDGLDEIMDRSLRARFCEQLEVVATQYEQAFLVITSRIVGYREMRRSLVHRFEHLVIADLSPADKDRFIASWCELTEIPERCQWAIRELKNTVHSSERIERLTGNPMLLTTLALVKRKVGKLPSRRHELYHEAVDVLLYWRPEIGELLDKEEVLPQLQYVAYAMCRDGLQQLRRDQLLSHLEDMRAAHASIRPIHKHSPEEFIALLEERTSLLIQAGEVRHHGEQLPVFEFRHFTFQEYLAALALVQGRFPGHTRRSMLADRVAPLAGHVSARDPQDEDSIAVSEHWHEPLRLCVTCCNDDDVDEVLCAIAAPLPGEDALRTSRPRAILAAWCLVDEPHASREAAAQVLRAFARQLREVDKDLSRKGSLAQEAALALFESAWAKLLKSVLIEEFIWRAPEQRAVAGGMAAIAEVRSLPVDRADMKNWLLERVARMEYGTREECIAAALGIMEAACIGRAQLVPRLIEALLALLERGGAVAHAAGWALAWLHEHEDHFGVWHPNDQDVSQLLAFISRPDSDPEALRLGLEILDRECTPAAMDACIPLLQHRHVRLATAAAYNLAHADGDRVAGPLLHCLRAPDLNDEVRAAAAYALGALGHLPALRQGLELIDSGDISGDLGRGFHEGLSDRHAKGVTALQRMDGSGIAELMLEYLKDTETHSSVRGTAAWILGDLGEVRAVEPLLACLSESSSPALQSDAAVALGRIGDSRAVEALLACLLDSNASEELQDSAAIALERVGDSRVIEPLLECLERFAPTSVMGMDMFTAMQQSNDPKIGPHVQKALATFVQNGNLCAAIIRTIARFRDERSDQPLLDRFALALFLEVANQKINGSIHIWIHVAILQEVAKFEPSRVADRLLASLKIPGVKPRSRSAIIQALGKMGAFPSAEPLCAILEDSTEAPEVRAAAAGALGRMRYPGTFELLARHALECEDNVAIHLPDVQPEKYGPHMTWFTYKGGSYALQLAAVNALSTLGEPRCLETLMRALRDPRARVRSEALQGLLRIRGDTLDTSLLLGNARQVSPLLDPMYTVFSQARMRRQAYELALPFEEIQRRYEALARDYDLLIEVAEQDAQR
jgi:HEAT repeat protein/adenylate kinase family enzyme